MKCRRRKTRPRSKNSCARERRRNCNSISASNCGSLSISASAKPRRRVFRCNLKRSGQCSTRTRDKKRCSRSTRCRRRRSRTFSFVCSSTNPTLRRARRSVGFVDEHTNENVLLRRRLHLVDREHRFLSRVRVEHWPERFRLHLKTRRRGFADAEIDRLPQFEALIELQFLRRSLAQEFFERGLVFRRRHFIGPARFEL